MATNILKVTNYVSDDSAENKIVTISPMVIKAVFADEVASIRQGKAVKNVTLLLVEGDEIALTINDSDLYTLEDIVGGYDFE